MQVKVSQRFTSKVSGTNIKVTKITRIVGVSSKFDRCLVSNTNDKGLVDTKTRRYVYADSIRRRYESV
jgi:hypothetical protein